ncbi:MAG: ATP-binding protein, partial [Prevotella sp.]|nr:ATP-binding protein [Prevotella sp.]
MKSESQTIEYKESWHDEYLKWICGFANAQGGTLYIGVNDDKQVVGVKNAKRLMEDIPNMVKDRMGILIDVNLLESHGKEYLQLITSSSPNPISIRGKYYYRTGSTLQELRGTALDQFLLSKQGRTWDSVPVPGLSARMLDAESINLFKKEAARSPHSSAEDVRGNRSDLLA